MISVHIELDSRHAITGQRLTTFILTYPRIIHSEMMTHRCKSINAASSRAIPIQVMMAQVKEHGMDVIEHWGAHQTGMGTAHELAPDKIDLAKGIWKDALESAIYYAKEMNEAGVVKQVANRLLEPFSHMEVVATFPEAGLRNFFHLRADPAAQPEFQVLATAMLDKWLKSEPRLVDIGEWHIPMAADLSGIDLGRKLKIATGRIAQISYLRKMQEGKHDEDAARHDKLMAAGHWSPFEHSAQAAVPNIQNQRGGNFGIGWRQYRKTSVEEMAKPDDRQLEARLLLMKEHLTPNQRRSVELA